jgi:hypothetical protein
VMPEEAQKVEETRATAGSTPKLCVPQLQLRALTPTPPTASPEPRKIASPEPRKASPAPLRRSVSPASVDGEADGEAAAGGGGVGGQGQGRDGGDIAESTRDDAVEAYGARGPQGAQGTQGTIRVQLIAPIARPAFASFTAPAPATPSPPIRTYTPIRPSTPIRPATPLAPAPAPAADQAPTDAPTGAPPALTDPPAETPPNEQIQSQSSNTMNDSVLDARRQHRPRTCLSPSPGSPPLEKPVPADVADAVAATAAGVLRARRSIAPSASEESHSYPRPTASVCAVATELALALMPSGDSDARLSQLGEPTDRGSLSGTLTRQGSRRSIRIKSTAPKKTTNTSGKVFHILVVDDSAMSRKMLIKTLRGDGHTCDEAEDGQLAVNRIREQGSIYDCVLMDFVMVRTRTPCLCWLWTRFCQLACGSFVVSLIASHTS